MSILSVDNISPIGSGTSVTVNSAATLVLTNANIAGVTTASGGVRVNADGNTSANYISVGASDDLKLYHQGGNSIIQNSTGYLELNANAAGWIKTTQFNIIDNDATHYHLRTFKDDRVELYHNNSKKLETTTDGVQVTGEVVSGTLHCSGKLDLPDSPNATVGRVLLGDSDDLQLYHDGNDSYIDDAGVGSLILRTTTSSNVTIKSTNDVMAKFKTADSVELYHNNSKKFETTSSGATITGNLAFPSGNGIDFSATGNSSGTMQSELLDDYEEGLFTPAITSGGSSLSYAIQRGSYTKIGDIVNFQIDLYVSGTPNGNHLQIGGLPFTTANQGTKAFGGAFLNYSNAAFSSIGDRTLFHLVSQNTYMKLYNAVTGNAIAGTSTGVDLFSNKEICLTGSYKAS